MKYLSEFDTLLLYINLLRKSHVFLKTSMFYKMIISFSSCALLMKKLTYLETFQFFMHKNESFAPKLVLTKPFVTLPQRLHIIIPLLGQKLTLKAFQNEKILLQENLFSPLERNISENGELFLQKWKYPSKLPFLQDFHFYQWNR